MKKVKDVVLPGYFWVKVSDPNLPPVEDVSNLAVITSGDRPPKLTVAQAAATSAIRNWPMEIFPRTPAVFDSDADAKDWATKNSWWFKNAVCARLIEVDKA